MTCSGRAKRSLGAVLLFVFLGPPASASGDGQAQPEAQPQSASELIRFLTYQSSRPYDAAFSCGAVYSEGLESERAARSLVRLRAASMPDLEEALDLLEKRGAASVDFPNAGWLLFVYAKISGSAGYPRLHRMTRNPDLAALRTGLDHSIAVSLGLTSYVSGVTEPVKNYFTCYRPEEPREALDKVILAWERNDSEWLEKNLGLRAKAVLSSMLKGRSWADVRA
jgi:hypothetical protein